MQLNNRFDVKIVPSDNYALAIRNSSKIQHKINWQSLIKIMLCAISLLITFALPAVACGGFPNNVAFSYELFTLPAIASIYSFGVPLIPIITAEAYILHKREDIPYSKACLLTTLANIFYLIACFVSLGSFGFIFPVSLIGSAVSAAMCVSFCQRIGYLKNISQGMFIFLVYLFFTGLGFANLFLVESFSVSADRTLLYAVTGGILLIGFIFSFVTKGFAIASCFKEKRPTLAATVMSMQVGSFPIVAIAYYITKLQPWWY
ncbi:MAG TPA: hypothetical protein V6D28_06290 [Leptolyngbyaceae cyanobacterium]